MVCFYCGGLNPDDEYCTCSLPTRYSSIAQQRFMAARASNEVQVDRGVGRLNEWLCLRPGPGRVRREH